MANITLLGVNYADVPAIDLPKTGGGTVRFSIPDLVQKTITLNGTYAAEDEQGAPDGYDEVTVNVQNGATMTEVANTYGTGVIISSAQGVTPSATRHTIYFEFEDETDLTVYAYYDNAFISSAITATTPTTYDNKTVTLAQLDGVTWYSYTPTPTPSIPLNTQLIDFNALTNGYAIYGDGHLEEFEWACVSDYTPVDPTMTFSIIGNPYYGTAFYDSSKSLISAVITSNLNGVLDSSNIPAGAAWVRITATAGADDTDLSLIRTA